MPPDYHYLTASKKISRTQGLETMLGLPLRHAGPLHAAMENALGVVAWGRKPSAARSEALARKHGLPLFRIEDGFLRSVGLGHVDPPLSVVIDDLGIYYDASGPSRLEQLISAPLDNNQTQRAHDIVSLWRAARVSKYNQSRETPAPVSGPFVLVVDQTFGDASVSYGLAEANSFARMLEAALDENPGLPVLLKIHPDVLAGTKKGYFSSLSPTQLERVRLLAEDCHPAALIQQAASIYVVTSQMGFEGLLWGKPVRTFGMPFYAGWGLTRDDMPAPVRRTCVGLENLVHASLVSYPRYLDPESDKPCSPERLIAWMGLQRTMRERFPETLDAVGFSSWKRPIMNGFFQGSTVRFHKSRLPDKEGNTNTPVLVWGMKEPATGSHEKAKRPVIRIEDGFLRSVGLGADLVRPVSWIIDKRGIYYDATRPSDLEYLIQNTQFDPALTKRAAMLRASLQTSGITKYNVGSGDWCRPDSANKVILVAGQVESDASLAFGAPGIHRNIELLRSVRAKSPEAYIVYKPHPDVVAGLRKTGLNEESADQWCNEIVIDYPISSILDGVDEVHVLTSLAGFEALLRGKNVTTYGQPFYAGWGLTTDMCPPDRRTRRCSLDELVAACLLLYPTYLSRHTGKFTTAEHALEELMEWKKSGGGKAGFITQLKRIFLRPIVGVR